MNSNKFENLFINPKKNRSVLYSANKGQVQKILSLPFPEISKYSISETGWVCAIKIKRRQGKKSFIYCVKLDQEFKIIKKMNIQIPFKYHVTAIAMRNNTVYIGGLNLNSGSKELSDYIDLTCADKEFNPVIIPEEYEMSGKAIDDIMVHGNRMILVDNIIFPKYLFEYDISQETAPGLSKVIKLPNNGTYEHIRFGKMSKTKIVLLSTTTGMGGIGRHLNILNSENFKNYGTISSVISLLPKKKQEHWFQDYTIWNNTLYLACGKKGLGILKLGRNNKKENVLYRKNKCLVNIKRFNYISNNCLVYQSEDDELKIIMMKEL